MQKLTHAESVIANCRAAAFAAILLIPPICQIDGYDNAVTRYYFLPLGPKLFIGTFLWPITLILMLAS